MNPRVVILLWVSLLSAGCGMDTLWTREREVQVTPGGFADDVAFLEAHTDVVILIDRSGQGRVAVLPAMQGRVMTSTATGPNGFSFGWINRELIASGRFVEHMNAFGGEDRFWLGPEGGQYSIFFEEGSPFELAHWHTPAPLDTEPWDLIAHSARSATLRKIMQVKNYSGTVFDLRVDREVRVLDRGTAHKLLGVSTGPGVSMVAFESNNRMVNLGDKPWTKETGLLSIWILGMFNPSPDTTVVIPFHEGPESELGPIVNDAYFGKVPDDRLVIGEGVLFFRGDGQYRSKIGLSPRRAKDVAGSYDAANQILTLVQYNKPKDALDYVNSMWEIQEQPYEGDVINAYNDGPPAPGAKPLGPFYELETSSPAVELLPGRSVVHTHRTFHLMGEENQLDEIAQAVLGASILEIKSALP